MATISEMVARHHAAILKRWLAQARRAASARGLDDPALTNIMPRFLASLATGEDAGELVERHFATRLRQGFQLAEVVDELALLGQCIVERALEEPAAERPGAADVDRLNARIHRASALVASLFDEHMSRDEQIDKHYVRLLRDVAAAALRGGTSALRSGLKDRLDVLVEAMGAQAAAIRLHNGEPAPITAATRGAAPLAAYLAQLEPRGLSQYPSSLDARRELGVRIGPRPADHARGRPERWHGDGLGPQLGTGDHHRGSGPPAR